MKVKKRKAGTLIDQTDNRVKLKAAEFLLRKWGRELERVARTCGAFIFTADT